MRFVDKNEELEARQDEIRDKIRELRKQKNQGARKTDGEIKADDGKAKAGDGVPSTGDEAALSSPARSSFAAPASKGTTALPPSDVVASGFVKESASTASTEPPSVMEDSGKEESKELSEEQILLNEMEAAEKFMAKGASVSSPEADLVGERKPEYKPTVSTWGVYARPDNISKAYGGGKNIPRGGVDLNSEDAREKAEQTRKLLQEFKISSGIVDVDEDKYRDETLAAIERSNELLLQARARQAAKLLEPLLDVVSVKTELGGDLYLQLAVVYEALGLRDSAQDLYAQLKKSPVQRIKSKAKRLSFGFTAMEQLNVDAESNFQMNWRVPDFDVKRKYETAYIGEKKKKQIGLAQRDPEISLANNIIAFVFLGSIILASSLIFLRPH